MVKPDMKVGDIFQMGNGYYKVLQVNGDGTYISQLQVGYVPDTVINDETVAEMKVAVEKKAEVKTPVKKAPVKKAPTKKK